ncbi:MAG: phosphomannomutase/phosphoglucomutase [Candidatus Nanoarchaeia archaeon]
MSIYRAYDIRGKVPSELDGPRAYKIALAYSSLFKPKRVVIGMDGRKHSKMLHDAMVKGLRDMGVNVTSVSLCTTPLLYYAGSYFDGSVMITASHLNGSFNGIKLGKKNNIPLSGKHGIYAIQKLVEKGDFSLSKRRGTYAERYFVKRYHSFISKFARKTDLKVIVDCSYGMALNDLPLLKRIAEVEAINTKMDFHKKGHIPDPLKKNTRKKLEAAVKRKNADIGIIFDGDCDRVCFVDGKGRFIAPDHVTGIIAEYLLRRSKRKGEPIVYEVRTTKAVPEMVKILDGKPFLAAAGRTFVREKLLKRGGLFGGEKSGHYFFRSTHYADNALLAAVLMLRYLDESGQTLEELDAPFSKYAQLPETNFRVKNKDKTIAAVERKFRRAKIRKIDGISVYLEDGWFNLRKSNTEPLIRLNAEADTRQALKKMKDELIRIING